jgi:hypothetical protein
MLNHIVLEGITMAYKKDQKMSATAVKKLVTNHTQKMWNKEEAQWEQIALSTVIKGPAVITEVIEMKPYLLMTAETETHRLRWNWKKDYGDFHFRATTLEKLAEFEERRLENQKKRKENQEE